MAVPPQWEEGGRDVFLYNNILAKMTIIYTFKLCQKFVCAFFFPFPSRLKSVSLRNGQKLSWIFVRVRDTRRTEKA